MLGNELNRFGSAEFADRRGIARAGLYEQTQDSLLIGFDEGRKLFEKGMGGLLMVAGARSGKLRDVLAYSICSGICQQSMVILDMKGELAAISQDQTPDQKFCIYFNPAGLCGLPQHSINPVDYVHIDSPTLVSDVKVFCENMIVASSATNAVYFERRGREMLEAIALVVTERDGVLTLPKLYEAINLMIAGGDAWLDFAFLMAQSRFPVALRIEEEIANSRDNPSNGFQGIMGEISAAFACLSDPILMRSVSPPFDFSFAQLCEGTRRYQVYLMPPAEMVGAWSPVIKAMFVAGMIYKSRRPEAPRQTWILDECAQLGAFPMVPKLFSYGAGIGIRPWAIYQSLKQMKATGPDTDTIITASAATRSFFGVRDIETATAISRMLGAQTLEFEDELRQSRARHASQQALQALLGGEDPFSAGLQYAHHKRDAEMPDKMHRLLRTPDEVLNTPPDKQFIFTDTLPNPLYADRRPYYEQRFMAGRYHPNPYHPPADKVRVKTRFGSSWRSVIRTSVPPKFAQYPQYTDGQFSKIEG